ncbi:hypothetical protein GCM10017620_22080 [Brevundimonas intermedia]|uniref:DUF2332 family protein n=2 Tax=Brevundimonas intermedia TaxID=74315 RepID=A0ABQ5TAX4_9CAUL|nr:hypothetical protein GCM10017620_22080 [Brevundimonas intermedia]
MKTVQRQQTYQPLPEVQSPKKLEKMSLKTDGTQDFLLTADRCRAMGSTFIASVLESVVAQLPRAPVSAAMICNWPGDPAAAALALRVNGALHALARRGTPKRLAQLYRGEHDDFDGAIAAALSEQDQFIADWLRHPTQTNEVARAGATMAALMASARQWGMPFELLELGSSCGLNLNLAHYAYRLGGTEAGDRVSTVRIEPRWRGAPPPMVPVSIATARGVDLHPLDASDPQDRERLLAFAWADQPARMDRLEKALEIARVHPPRVDLGDAPAWLAQRLAEPQRAGHCRAVVHTMFLQYLDQRHRADLTAILDAAGSRATPDGPLVWISFEWTPDRSEVELRLTTWPNGETRVLAKCHPYGDAVEWLDGDTGSLAP